MLNLRLRIAARNLGITESHRNAILVLADIAVGEFVQHESIPKLAVKMALADDPVHRKFFKFCAESLLEGKYKKSGKFAALVVTQMEMIAEELIQRNSSEKL